MLMDKVKPSYEDIFQRNIGTFTREEQEKIRNLKVAIAGGGGLGGLAAYMLARLGVGEIRIADPEEFDVSNINRQFGAYIDTIGQNKAKAIAGEILRINPFLKVTAISNALDKTNMGEFLEGADVVIDGIEFFELDAVLALHDEAIKNKLPIFTCQAVMEIVTATSFHPSGVGLRDLVVLDDKLDIRNLIDLYFPILPKSVTETDIERVILERKTTGSAHISSYMVSPELAVSILCQDLINIIIQGREPIVKAPNILVFDTKAMKMFIYEHQ